MRILHNVDIYFHNNFFSLDEANKAGLAHALARIILNRQRQHNFQLVCITHDEVLTLFFSFFIFFISHSQSLLLPPSFLSTSLLQMTSTILVPFSTSDQLKYLFRHFSNYFSFFVSYSSSLIYFSSSF